MPRPTGFRAAGDSAITEVDAAGICDNPPDGAKPLPGTARAGAFAPYNVLVSAPLLRQTALALAAEFG